MHATVVAVFPSPMSCATRRRFAFRNLTTATRWCGKNDLRIRSDRCSATLSDHVASTFSGVSSAFHSFSSARGYSDCSTVGGMNRAPHGATAITSA